MTALDPRLVDAVAVQRFGEDWDQLAPMQRFAVREDVAASLTAALALGWTPPETPEPCMYTHSHTREWCGNPGCRES